MSIFDWLAGRKNITYKHKDGTALVLQTLMAPSRAQGNKISHG